MLAKLFRFHFFLLNTLLGWFAAHVIHLFAGCAGKFLEITSCHNFYLVNKL